MEAFAYGTGKDLVCKKEEIKCYNIINQYKMINFGIVSKQKNIKEHNQNWSQIPDHTYKKLETLDLENQMPYLI